MMESFDTSKIRNVCLLGHSGSGKTSLAEAMLYFTKGTDRLGKTTDGNTVCDYDPEEIRRGFSLQAAIAPVMWNDKKINVIDTPGYLDFVSDVMQAVRVADCSIIVVDGKAGIEVGTELSWDHATEAGIPKSFFINKCDDPDFHFENVFNRMREKFGISVCPVFIPIQVNREIKGFFNLINMKAYIYGKNGSHTEGTVPAEFKDKAAEFRNIYLESIAETSEALMEKFFAEEEITEEEALEAIHNGIVSGSICPVICGSSSNLWSVDELLNIIAESYPAFTAKGSEKIIVDGKVTDTPIEPDGTPAIFVFKTVADPFGKMTYFKVMNGTLSNDLVLKNMKSGVAEKFSHIYMIRGKKQIEVDKLSCGDIGMTVKLVGTNTNDTLTTAANTVEYAPIIFPEPFLTMCIVPKAKGDEDKISTGIARLLEEDYTLKYENNSETNQLLLSGLGDMHLDVVVSKLKNRYSTGIDLVMPRIAYRETIKKKVSVEGKHKKQSGGSGQYGHVKITFGPGEAEGLTFTQSVTGGTVPKGYYPAVEKGLLEAMQKGVLAGFPVVHLAADLFDGSFHPVDSNEISFKLAAKLAYKAGLPLANPVILEPIGELKVCIPENLVGDVMGDINKRRGRVLGINAVPGKKGYQVIEAEVPKAEMLDYSIALRAMSQGKGIYTFYVSKYEETPSNVAQKIIAEAKVDAEAEK